MVSIGGGGIKQNIMVTYFDEDGRPMAQITVGGARTQVEIEALIDTGFDGAVCIPVRIATQLGLELVATEFVEFADGSTKHELVFSGTVVVDNAPTDVEIGLTESEESLVGLDIFEECVLVMDFVNTTIEVKKLALASSD